MPTPSMIRPPAPTDFQGLALSTKADGVQVVEKAGAWARLEPLPMGPIGLAAWAPFVAQWAGSSNPQESASALPVDDVIVLLDRLQSATLPPHVLEQALGRAVLSNQKRSALAVSDLTPDLMRQEIAVALLLEQGARFEARDLASAVHSGNPRLIQRLLAAQPDLINGMAGAWTADTLQESPLLKACTCSDATGARPIALLLLDAGMSPDHQDRTQGRSALHWAAASQNLPVLTALLDRGANPNVRNLRGHTPLDYAVARNHRAAILALVDHGADPLAPVPDDLPLRTSPLLGFETPRLREAVLPHEVAQARITRTVYPDTPLLQAAIAGAAAAMDTLIEKGAEPFPLIDPHRPDGPRDERILGLLDLAQKSAENESDTPALSNVQACRVLLEQYHLRRLFDPAPNDPARPTVPDGSRWRARL